jgi:acetyl esterase/lipase
VRRLRANAEKYRIDPNRFGAWGPSAGGHLVAILGLTRKTNNFDVGEHLEISSQVQVVVSHFGPTDFLHIIAYTLASKCRNMFRNVSETIIS